MEILHNPHRGRGLEALGDLGTRVVSDPKAARALFQICPLSSVTPLRNEPELAGRLGVGGLHLKDESDRMGLGSFKALGAVHAISRLAVEIVGTSPTSEEVSGALKGEVFVCASAGNHGLSVAAGARIFGARAVVYVSEAVPEAFATRLRERGAEVVRSGSNYEESMMASLDAAQDNGWTLLSDSSWPGYEELPSRVMEGYLISGAEVVEAVPVPPSHIFLQAGVGGFAAAMTALFRSQWGDGPVIVVVEPQSARCLTESVRAGQPVVAPGPVSTMGRLDCKEVSHIALARLAADADYFVAIEDEMSEKTVLRLAEHGVETTPSGAAGLSGAWNAAGELGLDESSRVLAFITEGPETIA